MSPPSISPRMGSFEFSNALDCSYSAISRFAQTITELAFRSFFVLASVWCAAFVIPISWQAVVLPFMGIGSLFLSSFFVSKTSPIETWTPPSSALLYPIEQEKEQSWPRGLPLDAPRGYTREMGQQNCCFNAAAHFLDQIPFVKQWLRSPLHEKMSLEELKAYLAPYHFSDSLWKEFERSAFLFPSLSFLPRLYSAPSKFEAFLKKSSSVEARSFYEVFRALRILHPVLATFFQHNDEALEHQRPVSKGDSQMLREALHQCFPYFSNDPKIQLDAVEILLHILNLLPQDQVMMQVETLRELDPREHPPVKALKPERNWVSILPLPLSTGNWKSVTSLFSGKKTLHDLLKAYLSGAGFETSKIRLTNRQGEEQEYQIRKEQHTICSPPRVLLLALNRFEQKKPSGRSSKLYGEVGVPKVLSLKVKGKTVLYQLKTVLTHFGSFTSGHFTAEIISGQGVYHTNDETVSFSSFKDSKRLLEGGYAFCYLPVEPRSLED